ncbi:MAG: di-trans,poly-cis-decaprenylcistransferase [Oceanospirillaceae bacterium]|nr:di-trans,poly-cis-decaprenylcistransferase [Oceanospirillaceae bacterium]|tara:strand:+ start:514 stop:1281 length:768 start_codon:yes stop_codon:yes gene_type:complete
MSTSIDDKGAVAGNVPRHVAIIMDGNNRWAKKRLMPGIAGHKSGVEAVRSVVEVSARSGVEVLTLFAFSSENWRRPATEVSALMQLFTIALEREVKRLKRNNLRLVVIGDKSAFSEKIQTLIANAEELTAANTGMTLVIAANYGGQWDIAQAARKVAEEVRNGRIEAADIDESLLHRHTCLSQYPAPDLLIRTGGEQRISNFLLWQCAYSEFYFCDAFWPDFREVEYQKALDAFANRTRRFGRTDDQLKGVSDSD